MNISLRDLQSNLIRTDAAISTEGITEKRKLGKYFLGTRVLNSQTDIPVPPNSLNMSLNK